MIAAAWARVQSWPRSVPRIWRDDVMAAMPGARRLRVTNSGRGGRAMRRLVTLSALVLLSGCGAEISERTCPRVSEFPVELQRQAAVELATAPTLARMMDVMAADRAFNRAICG